ncbi:glycosyltransferase family 2 protein [Poseidonibacter ostreae]|uniref:Glycosyltransferase n=1 Tax=Poseidonibacter ostreae TaxID=2654171 RepID=A0ABQ6VRC7_9BACT|nr:glycosyltransferase family 2 protein [Poseidonibacter ostreae]KAB7892660.1 glycosyltransferase [Poseidonibacter ostreae]
MKLSIVVPCYNEEKNIPLILEKFQSVINRNDVEVLLVNNGSTDNSQTVFDELVPKYTFARVVNIDENQGYGFGITSGLNKATGEFISYTHADMQTDPSDVLKSLGIIEKQDNPIHCYVKGDRKGRPLFDQIFTMGMSAFESIYLGKKLWDINAQPNIFHKSFFDSVKLSCPKDFSLDLYFLYKAQIDGLDVIRFNVVFPERLHGESSWNDGFASKWKFIKRTLAFSFKLKKEL